MTTCLAAICNQNQSIVTVADTKLSYGYTGTHARKIHGIHREWLVMWAGHASPCSQALDYARGHIDHLPKTAQQLTEIFIAACQRRPCTEDEDRWFLLAGFEQHIPHLYVLHDDATLSSATVRCCDDAGFAAIGSGSFVAEHMLTLFGPPQVRTEAEAVYTSCAAKFFTERATDVGVDTHTCVLRLDKYGVSYDLRVQSLVPKIRRAWETKGQVPIPASITRKIAKHLDIA